MKSISIDFSWLLKKVTLREKSLWYWSKIREIKWPIPQLNRSKIYWDMAFCNCKKTWKSIKYWKTICLFLKFLFYSSRPDFSCRVTNGFRSKINMENWILIEKSIFAWLINFWPIMIDFSMFLLVFQTLFCISMINFDVLKTFLLLHRSKFRNCNLFSYW